MRFAAILTVAAIVFMALWFPARVEEPGDAPSVCEEQPSVPAVAVRTIQIHKVVAGDTPGEIAEAYGIDLETLYAANPALSRVIYPDQELVVLPCRGLLHQVAEGETLHQLAGAYGIQPETILSVNGLTSDNLEVGKQLILPGARARQEVSRRYNRRLLWPTDGEISSEFGPRWGRLHAGVDIANDSGTPVGAARSGVVIFAGWYGGYGYAVEIEHDGGYTTLYAHLDEYLVTEGDPVGEGELIGRMGETGNADGAHLHFEVRREGQPVDPLSLLP